MRSASRSVSPARTRRNPVAAAARLIVLTAFLISSGCTYSFRAVSLPPAHIPDGGVLAVTREALLHQIEGVAPDPHAFLGAKRGGVVTGEGEVIDIDCRVDQLVADAILRERLGLNEHQPTRRWRRTG